MENRQITVGDKVRLDVKAIRKQPGWPRSDKFLPGYVEFVKNNARKTFVVTKVGTVCELEGSVWTFWEGHLKLVKRWEK